MQVHSINVITATPGKYMDWLADDEDLSVELNPEWT